MKGISTMPVVRVTSGPERGRLGRLVCLNQDGTATVEFWISMLGWEACNISIGDLEYS